MTENIITFENKRAVLNGTTFFVCLPEIYCDYMKLEKGDIFSMDLDLNNKTLILRKVGGDRNDRTKRETGERTARDGTESKDVLENGNGTQ